LAAEPGSEQAAWQQSTVEYSVDPVEGVYKTVVDQLFTVESVTDIQGAIVPSTEYDVYYFDDDTASDNITNGTGAASAVNNQLGGVPNEEGNYIMLIVKGELNGQLSENSTLNGVKGAASAYIETKFVIEKKTTSIDSATPYEVQLNADETAEDTKNFTDTTFSYTGEEFAVAFTVNGKKLTSGDYDIVWTEYAGSDVPEWKNVGSLVGYGITNAGDYSAKITGKGEYAGTATVEFTVSPIDLSTADVVFAPRLAETGIDFTTSTGVDAPGGILKNSKVTVNGMDISDDADFEGTLIAFNDAQVSLADYDDVVNTPGKYTFKLVADDNQENVTGECTVDAYLVNQGVKFEYAGGSFPTQFDPQYNQAFNPDYITAETEDINGQKVTPEFTVKVLKDGEEVTSYSEPGDYTVVLDAPVATYGGKTYAAHETHEFKVVGKDYSGATAFVFVDDEAVTATTAPGKAFGYEAKDLGLDVVVRMDGTTLAEGTDYEVSLTDADGNAVEAIQEIGKYCVTVTGKDYAKTEIAKVYVEVTKATIAAAKATADFFGTDGETAAAPTFVGSTESGEDFDKGVKFDLSADEISVTYNEVAWKDTNEDGKIDAGETTVGAAVDAADLTEAGWYQATINVLSTAKNIKTTSAVTTFFEVKEIAGYNDVPATAWYADSVYKAKDNGYMEGVAAGIFAPEKAMTRAEFAQVVANMAGVGKADIGETYPTQFADVPADAWYAKAVEWAARYGIVTGTSETTFAPNETISREQIAAMFYRYAGNGAKADLSALDQFEDADQVSGWAKEAMAWAIEEGYMNGTSETTLAPSETAQRAQIAAIAVRVQPEAL
jgi:hypothetical protein